MHIALNVGRKTIEIDYGAPIYCAKWPYLQLLHNVSTINYDTSANEGQIHFSSSQRPSIDLSNPVYAPFVKRLVVHVRDFLGYGTILDIQSTISKKRLN